MREVEWPNEEIYFNILSCCSCEPLAMTMVRANLNCGQPLLNIPTLPFALNCWIGQRLFCWSVKLHWRTSSRQFTWPQIILTECLMNSLCQVFRYRRGINDELLWGVQVTQWNVTCIVPCLQMHESRKLLCHLNFLCDDLDMGNVCPTCPKVTIHACAFNNQC